MSESRLIEALLTGKPYFGPAMRVTQSPPVRHGYLTALVAALAQSKRYGRIHILEIGSWAGASAVTWAMAVQRLGRKGKIICVDRWQPYFDERLETARHYQAMNEAARGEKVFKLFLHNIRAANVEHMVDYRVGDARKILPELPEAKYDIVYIDGSHLYESVRADIHDAKRLVRDGGIICGDDLELQRTCVDDREHRTVVKLNKDFVHSSKANADYHPGVTEAVAAEFGEVSNWEGVWAIRKLGSQWAKVELDALAVQIPSHVRNAAAMFDAAEEVSARAIEPGEERIPLVELVDSTSSFNLIKVKSNGRFLAVAKQLGPTDLFVERLGERELAPLLFSGESLDEIREKAVSCEKENGLPSVELLQSEGEYNLLKAGGRYFAVAKTLGPLSLFQERLGERELPPVLFITRSFQEAKRAAQGSLWKRVNAAIGKLFRRTGNRTPCY